MKTLLETLNKPTDSEQVIDVKSKLDNASQGDIFTKHQQPRDKNTLQVIMERTFGYPKKLLVHTMLVIMFLKTIKS